MCTQGPHARTRCGRWRGALLVIFVAAVLLIGAAPAAAAPPPTLGLGGLQAELATSGTVDGFMKTSMSGTTVTTIPVKILAIVDGFYWGKLIMFECTAPAVIDIGGIASGMSGSPVYVNVDGTDRIVGAVSYGDMFTLRGTGLATPIEYMTALQDEYGSAASNAEAKAVDLETPVVTSAGVVRKLVLGTETTASSAAADTSVMHPLAEARITGLSSGSTAYKNLAAKLEASGLTVLSGDSTGGSASTPALEPGSPCGISFSTGLYSLSVLGTVTYVDGDDVLMFGHPILGSDSGFNLGLGPIEGALTGATVDAVWPSTMAPYKMMTPADAKGVATQDRSAGVVAKLGGAITMFPVTTHTTVDGAAAVTDVTSLGDWLAVGYWPELLSSYGISPGITTSVASVGLYHGLDSEPLVGSATTTTTVVVNDGSQDFTLTHDNIWDNVLDDSSMNLADAAAGDVTTIMANVLDDPYGVRNVRVKSVDVTARFSLVRRHGGITDATIGRAIRWGANTVDVTYYRTGSAEPQTFRATLDVPEGTNLSGYVMATGASWSSYSSDYFYEEETDVPLTMAQTKEVVDALPRNSDVFVAYVPDSSGDDFEDDYEYGPDPAAEATIHSDWVCTGGVEKDTATVVVRTRGKASMSTPIPVTGYVRGASKDVPVAIYCQEAGKAQPTKPTLKVTAERSGSTAPFTAVLPGFKHNVLLTAEVGALSDDSLPGADQIVVKVRAATRLAVARSGGGLTLTARVTPADATGKVQFQRQVHGRWVSAGSATLKRGVAKVKTGTATHVRARFAGGDTNAASTWTSKPVK